MTPSQPASTVLPPKLNRTTFHTSREMDFFSEKELVTQTGHEVADWPLVFLKETLDNALDACDEAEIAPRLEIVADAGGLSVQDNGPGLPESTLTAALDFRVRASNREAYVAPDRGAQGNALKTLIPMPVVLDPEQGRLIVAAHGKCHRLSCRADPISQQPVLRDDVTDVPTTGTCLRMEWEIQQDPDDREIVWPFDELRPQRSRGFASRFREMLEGFALFNPHAAIRCDWFGEVWNWEAIETAWKKWAPHQPTSSHWYEPAHLRRLIAAYIAHDRRQGTDRLVSELIAEFDGMSGSQKRARVLEQTGLRRARLSDFVRGDTLDDVRIEALLRALQSHSRPVKADMLGVIGEDALRSRLLAMGVRRESFRYSRKRGKEQVPWILESAFGWRGDQARDERKIFAGANWSAAIKNPFRSFGQTGQGLEAALTEMRAGASEPIVFVLHLAHPRVEYTDRGKSALIISSGGGQ